jgi:hypothetical protein
VESLIQFVDGHLFRIEKTVIPPEILDPKLHAFWPLVEPVLSLIPIVRQELDARNLERPPDPRQQKRSERLGRPQRK